VRRGFRGPTFDVEVGVCEQSTSIEGECWVRIQTSRWKLGGKKEIDAKQFTRRRNNMVDVEVLVDIQTLGAVAASHRLEPEPACSSSLLFGDKEQTDLQAKAEGSRI